MICFPLHFGNFAGLGLKIVYALFGLTSGALAFTGIALSAHRWRARRRAKIRRRSASDRLIPLPNATKADA
jgi:uncharacterized iron-regulated membrane protein